MVCRSRRTSRRRWAGPGCCCRNSPRRCGSLGRSRTQDSREGGRMAASFQRLDADDARAFAEDGYVVKRGYFLAEEVDLAQRMIESDPAIQANVLKIADSEGGSTALALWNHPG